MVDFYSNRYMFSTTFHSCCMHGLFCCCIDDFPNDHKFRGKALKIKNTKVVDPEEINWDSFDISWCSKITRVLLAIFVVLVFIVICSTLVALCSIFIQTNAVNCSGYDSITYETAKTTSDSMTVTCFCNSELLNFWNGSIQ